MPLEGVDDSGPVWFALARRGLFLLVTATKEAEGLLQRALDTTCTRASGYTHEDWAPEEKITLTMARRNAVNVAHALLRESDVGADKIWENVPASGEIRRPTTGRRRSSSGIWSAPHP